MPKQARELSAVEIRKLSKAGTYAVGGVAGLQIIVLPTGAKCWTLRTKVGDLRREIGLGGFPAVSLADARAEARTMRAMIREGVDPVEQRKANRLSLIQSQARGMTFAEAAKQCHAVKAQEFRNAKHASQWYATLEKYALPHLGKLPIADIDTSQVLDALTPIWAEKTETASRVRQRMAAVFDWARAAGKRTAPNPAAWKDNLEPLLAQPDKLRKTTGNRRRHHPALPIEDMPRLMADLAARDTPSAHALRFTILTAARSGEVRLATWAEIDLQARVWRLSADRMKGDKAHTVPLYDDAVAILNALPRDSEYLFANSKGQVLSDMALSKLLKDAHAADVAKGGPGYLDPLQGRIATPHGTARSTFKDWARKNPRFPDEWSELALAHINSDETRSAYARDELLAERRELMAAWSAHCVPPQESSVVQMRGHKK